jgi:serine/threonine protein kinase
MTEFPEIPGYKIKKKLGQGGMADVYLGVQENLSRMVAIKVLNLQTARNPRLAKRFVKEARTLSRLIHPNIVTIYDVGQQDHYYYIVMEYLQDSLKEKIKRDRKLSPQEALAITMQVGDALFFAHDKGVVHRDIKPDNILFRKDGVPVVLDFGIAKVMDSKTKLTKTGMSIGTPQYMSPEQCNAESLDGRSDIYSLGVVLYEMLTGKAPYDAVDTLGIAMKHLKDPVPVLPSGLKYYQSIIDRMMAKQKKKRPHSRKELNEIIKNLMNLTAAKTNSKSDTPMNTRGKTKNADSKTLTAALSKEKPKTEEKPRSPGTPKAKKAKTKPKRRVILWIWLAVLVMVFVFLLANSNALTDLIDLFKRFFSAIGEILF